MRKYSNDCGFRNSFGYYDARSKEIVLKRPCFTKKDIDEVYNWIDDASDLLKFSVSIGVVENIVVEDTGDSLYASAKEVILKTVLPTVTVDNEVLSNMLDKLKNASNLHNLALRCYVFENDPVAFNKLLQLLKQLDSLVYLDFGGCYFSENQLLELTEVIAKKHIGHLVWSEPRMTKGILTQVFDRLKDMRSLVFVQGMPAEFKKMAQANRNWLFDLGRYPTMIATEKANLIKDYASSIRIGLAHEKQNLFDLEKTMEGILS